MGFGGLGIFEGALRARGGWVGLDDVIVSWAVTCSFVVLGVEVDDDLGFWVRWGEMVVRWAV